MSTPLRRAVERHSLPVIAYLRALPVWAPLTAIVLLALGGLFAPRPVGPILLAIVAAFLGWLTYLAWPALMPPARIARLVTVLLVLGAVVQRTLAD